jgi:hypothetical protein
MARRAAESGFVCSPVVKETSWVGIDGLFGAGSGDELNGGTLSQAKCQDGAIKTSYYAWFEWVPTTGIERFSSFPVKPADDMYVVVYDTSPTEGFCLCRRHDAGCLRVDEHQGDCEALSRRQQRRIYRSTANLNRLPRDVPVVELRGGLLDREFRLHVQAF